MAKCLKLCVNILALTYTASNEKCSWVYVIYMNLFEDHFWWPGLGVSTVRRLSRIGHGFCS